MASKRIEHFGKPQTTTFLCDNESDKDAIPNAAFGDEVIVINTNTRYMKSSGGEWLPV